MPSLGNGISGIGGDLLIAGTQIHEVKKWSFKPKIDTKDYASNITAGYKKRVLAVKDASGTIDGVWDPWDPITTQMDVGSLVTLHLQLMTGQFISAPSIIDDLSIEVDIETGAVESWTASFSANGAWVNAIALSATTTTTGIPLMGPMGSREVAKPLKMDESGNVILPEAQQAFSGVSPDRPAAPPATHGGSVRLDRDQLSQIAREVAAILKGESPGPGGHQQAA